jgi:DNA gyrase subunit A
MMAVKSGRAVCFRDDKVRPTGRGAIGVFGIELENEEDEVIGMICLPKKDINKQILVVSENGLGKRTPFLMEATEAEIKEDAYNLVQVTDEDGNEKNYALSYRITNRGGKGVKTINITEKTGALVGLLSVEEKDDLMITCESGVTIRMKVSSIREAGRATQGVKLINIDGGDKIAAIAAIRDQGEDEEILTDENGNVIAPDGAAVATDDTAAETGEPDTETEEPGAAPETDTEPAE